MTSSASPEQNLVSVLERARTAGFLGPGPLRVHTAHAEAFAIPIPDGANTLLDLGSGGGLPGLPLFVRIPRLEGALFDASEKRCAFLQWAVAELGLGHRVEVIRGRAEDWGHEESVREKFDVVSCRGFGPPAATIEAGVGFLAPGGTLIVSEPPGGRQWSKVELAKVGLSQLRASSSPGVGASDTSVASEALVVAFERVGDIPDALPRPIRKQRSKPLKVLSN